MSVVTNRVQAACVMALVALGFLGWLGVTIVAYAVGEASLSSAPGVALWALTTALPSIGLLLAWRRAAAVRGGLPFKGRRWLAVLGTIALVIVTLSAADAFHALQWSGLSWSMIISATLAFVAAVIFLLAYRLVFRRRPEAGDGGRSQLGPSRGLIAVSALLLTVIVVFDALLIALVVDLTIHPLNLD